MNHNLYLNEKDFLEDMEKWNIIKPLEDYSCEKCEGKISLTIRTRKNNKFFYLRCVPCNTEQSLFKNTFFSFTKENRAVSKLPAMNVLNLIYFYLEGNTIERIKTLTGIKSDATIVNWSNFIRDEITKYLNSREKLGGVDKVIQIDESLFRGKRKYNRGRLLLGESLIQFQTITREGRIMVTERTDLGYLGLWKMMTQGEADIFMSLTEKEKLCFQLFWLMLIQNQLFGVINGRHMIL